MTYPVVTSVYAALLSFILVALSAWVIAGRVKFSVNHGDGGNAEMNRRIRAHANFAEYVPLILLLVGLLEAGGASRITVNVLLLPLLVVRLMHPIGMVAPDGSKQQGICRGGAASVTLLVLVASAVLLLVHAL